MKILTAENIRKADSYTIENEPIASIDLMERASRSFVTWFVSKFKNNTSVSVICGTGNNGGDGLAISRLLLEKGYKVHVMVVRVSEKSSEDFNINFSRLSKMMEIREIQRTEDIPDQFTSEVIIDGIFGSGLSRPAENLFAEVIEAINRSPGSAVAIDIASGLFSDQPNKVKDAITEVDYTISFQVPKLAFFMAENDRYVGEWHVVDIGLDKDFITRVDSPYQTITAEKIKNTLRFRGKFDHKGNFGKVLIASGGLGKMGATVLCSKACLRAGAGLVTVHIPRCGYEIMQTAVPEAMTILDENDEMLTSFNFNVDDYSVYGTGPGIGTHSKTVKALSELFEKVNKPMVIDADALNILAKERSLLALIPENSILTPHPGEFKRLVGAFENSYEKLEKQISFSKENKVFLVLKGGHTSVSAPEGIVHYNMTGNPGMATGGSGDVLTGILTGLLGQQYDPLDTCCLGVYLHGLAGRGGHDCIGYYRVYSECISSFD